MCDYSLEYVASRPAKVGDKLVSTSFAGSITRGFAAVGEPNVAVCLLPGTELAFQNKIKWSVSARLFGGRVVEHTVARFRHINEDRPNVHHDALEFPNGDIVLLTQLQLDQTATVLQLPADPTAEKQADVTAPEPIAEMPVKV